MNIKEAIKLAEEIKDAGYSTEECWIFRQIKQAINDNLQELILIKNDLIFTKEALKTLKTEGFTVENKGRLITISGW